MAGFSSIMKITDLDDFIAPSQECIKPVTSVAVEPSSKRSPLQIQGDGPAQSGESELRKATINLSDCLACSGCVTSAEVVLVSQQSSEQLRRVLEEAASEVVVSMCPQAVVSLAHKWSLAPGVCARKLSGYFRKIGVTEVWDTNLARSISLLEAAKEFNNKFKIQDKSAFPVLASACPGWICYAEKTQTESLLSHISQCRSPQQIMGSLVNRVWAARHDKSLSKVFHVTLMPCFDKKLEASRKEFEEDLTANKDVDLVITSIELEQMLEEDGFSLSDVPEVALSPDLSSGELLSHKGSSAGGYADFILRYIAQTVYDITINEINWTTLKNADLQEASLEVNGETVLRVCRAYGFRNLQNIVQKIKRKKNVYHYIEIMACPSGCVNGGAQIRPREGTSAKDMVSELEVLYRLIPTVDPTQDTTASQIIEQLKNSEPYFATTSYKVIEKNVGLLGIKW